MDVPPVEVLPFALETGKKVAVAAVASGRRCIEVWGDAPRVALAAAAAVLGVEGSCSDRVEVPVSSAIAWVAQIELYSCVLESPFGSSVVRFAWPAPEPPFAVATSSPAAVAVLGS